MFSKQLSFLFPLLFVLTYSCVAQVPVETITFSGGKKILILNKQAAADAIIVDRTDGFFEKVTISEMSIQMKKKIGADWSRQMVVEDYKNYLREDVADFTAAESAYVVGVMDEVYSTCALVSPALLPNELNLIKTTAKHYGESVYYTRDNCIVIPMNELDPSNRENFKHTMFHELSHVVSRQNPALREKLYSLIGFHSIGYSNIRLTSQLASRVFFNPDGVDFAQAIDLKTLEGNDIKAIPIIYSSKVGYDKSLPNFFSYLKFELYQILPNQDGTWSVLTQNDQVSSTLDLRKLPDFFHKIKENTHYIIHPDEIIADNFTFLMESKKHPNSLDKYNAEGKELIQSIEQVIKSPESVFVTPMQSANK